MDARTESQADKYPGVESGRLVPSLSEQRRVVEAIRSTNIETGVADVIESYHRHVDERDYFLWQWLNETMPATRLNTVPDRHRGRVRRLKLALSVFVVIADDCAEKVGDDATFQELRRVLSAGGSPRPDADGVDADAVRVAMDAWSYLQAELEGAPRYEEFRDAFRFDLRETFGSMDYARLVTRQPSLANRLEMETYGPHNMMMFPMADIDLMYSPDFESRDSAPLRRTVWRAQRLGSIANAVATWERELRENDPASEIFVRARDVRALTADDLSAIADEERSTEGVASRIRDSGVEAALLEEWRAEYRDLLDVPPAASVDLEDYVRGMPRVLRNYLAAQE